VPDPDARLSPGGFAALVGVTPAAVRQYRTHPAYPDLDSDGRARAGDLAHWWANRPGPGNRTRGPGRVPDDFVYRADQVADRMRAAVDAGTLLTPAALAADFGIGERSARIYLAEVVDAVADEFGLLSLHDLADDPATPLRATTPESRYVLLKRLFKSPDAPTAVAMRGKERLYRPEQAAAFLRRTHRT
jgi:hypothetical protein